MALSLCLPDCLSSGLAAGACTSYSDNSTQRCLNSSAAAAAVASRNCPRLYGGGMPMALAQVAAVYYAVALVLHCFVPWLLRPPSIQSAPRRDGQAWREARNSLGDARPLHTSADISCCLASPTSRRTNGVSALVEIFVRCQSSLKSCCCRSDTGESQCAVVRGAPPYGRLRQDVHSAALEYRRGLPSNFWQLTHSSRILCVQTMRKTCSGNRDHSPDSTCVHVGYSTVCDLRDQLVHEHVTHSLTPRAPCDASKFNWYLCPSTPTQTCAVIAKQVLYMLATVVSLDYLHDAWFYWTHRLLHWQPLYRSVHHIHHECARVSSQ